MQRTIIITPSPEEYHNKISRVLARALLNYRSPLDPHPVRTATASQCELEESDPKIRHQMRVRRITNELVGVLESIIAHMENGYTHLTFRGETTISEEAIDYFKDMGMRFDFKETETLVITRISWPVQVQPGDPSG